MSLMQQLPRSDFVTKATIPQCTSKADGGSDPDHRCVAIFQGGFPRPDTRRLTLTCGGLFHWLPETPLPSFRFADFPRRLLCRLLRSLGNTEVLELFAALEC